MTFEAWWTATCPEPWRLEGRESVDFARAAWKAATSAERERCAQLVAGAGAYTEWNEDAVACAEQIRAG